MEIIDERVIELRELRIGNILEYKGQIVCVTMLSCDIDDEYEDQIGFVKFGVSSKEMGGWNRSLVNDLKRVPLTPEWLERCGCLQFCGGPFIKRFAEDITFGYEYLELIQYPKDDFWYVWHGKFDGQDIDVKIPMKRHIQYVHDFQNLCHSLTGEELTIKEKV